MTNKEALSRISKEAGLAVNLDPASITIWPCFKRRQFRLKEPTTDFIILYIQRPTTTWGLPQALSTPLIPSNHQTSSFHVFSIMLTTDTSRFITCSGSGYVNKQGDTTTFTKMAYNKIHYIQNIYIPTWSDKKVQSKTCGLTTCFSHLHHYSYLLDITFSMPLPVNM